MAHSHHAHRASHVSKHRVSHITKGYACGGMARKGYKRGGGVHSDEKEDRKLISKMLKEHEKVEGRARGGRLDKFARGGKTKHHKGTQVNIAVVNPSHHGGPPSAAGGPPAGGGLPAPGGPPAPPPRPPMGPPGAGPGMPIGGPMAGPMKPPGMMNRGGKVRGQKGGDNGVGRKDKAKMYGLKPIKGRDE